MTKSQIIDWYCSDQDHHIGCESCKADNYSRRSECLPVKRLSAMLDELIQSAPGNPKIFSNVEVKVIQRWKEETSK